MLVEKKQEQGEEGARHKYSNISHFDKHWSIIIGKEAMSEFANTNWQ